MTFRKSLLLLTALATIATLVGCSSSSKPITLTLNSVPTSLIVNSQTSLSASVANDKANGGVTWSCTTTPAGSPCGTFNPTTTASGASTTYTAPGILLPANTTITITATSVTNSAISQSSQPITIVAATLADGNYVFSLSGFDTSDEVPYRVAGVFTVAGGVIMQGEQDFVDFYGPLSGDQISAGTSGCSATTTPIVSCLTTTADGNLQIILVTGDSDLGISVGSVNGVEILNGSVYPLNPGKAAITEYDGSASGSGVLELQNGGFTSGTAPGPVSYAFAVGGVDQEEVDGGPFFPFAMGGVIYVDGAAGTGTISGTGSVFDANVDFSGITYQNQDFANTSIVSPADAFGRVTFTLDSASLPELILAGYVVSPNKIQLVETVDSLGGAVGGTAFTQTVPSGGFTAANSAATYVIGVQGFDTSYFLQAASQLTLASAGSVSGFVDYNDLSPNQQVSSPDPVSAATSTVDSTGRVTISGLSDGENVTYNLQLYLDGNGHALAITLDESDALGGAGYVQGGTGAFADTDLAGTYTMGTTGWDVNGDGEFDTVGPVLANGSNTFTGFNDVNWLNLDSGPLTVSDNTVTGAFTANAGGIFTGTITGIDMTTCPAFTSDAPGCTADVFNYYLIDATGDNIAIETDLNQQTLGVISQQ